VAPLFIVLAAAALARALQRRDAADFHLLLLLLAGMLGGNLPLAVLAAASRAGTGGIERWLSALLLLAGGVLALAASDTAILYRSAGTSLLAIAALQAAAAVLAWRAGALRAADLLVGGLLIAPALAPLPDGEPIPPALLPLPLGGTWRWAVAAAYAGAALGFALHRPDAGTARQNRSRIGVAQFERLALPLLLLALVGGATRAYLAGTVNYLPADLRSNLEAQLWLRAHSAPDALVLPLDADSFSTLSRRPVWVEPKLGAAVQWAPAYHAVWQPRMAALARLKTMPEVLDYAARNGIAYVVVSRRELARFGAVEGELPVIHAGSRHLVLAVPPAARGRE